MELKDSDFSKLKRGEVHKDGWGVRFEGRETCVYFEGKLETSFEFTVSFSPRRPTTFTAYNPGKWDAPNSSIVMPESHWALIKERLTAYLEFAGGWDKFVVEDR